MDVVELLEDLVAIDSTNRSIDPAGAGEQAMAERLGSLLGTLGFTVERAEVAPGRPNVIGTRAGPPGSPTILFEAHLDTVPAPAGGIPVHRHAGRLTGRGSCDCKGALAAMLVAITRVLDRGDPPCTIVVAGSVDEEASMTGAAALLQTLPPVDLAIIAEPTSLVPIRAHNGFVRFVVTAHGRSAHSAKAHLGVSAVTAAADLVQRVDRTLLPVLLAAADPLTGPGLLTAATIHGGVAANMVPDRCEILFDRRTPPGLSIADALRGVDELIAESLAEGHELVRAEPYVALPGMALPADHAAVRLAERATTAVTGRPALAGGVSFATDACRLAGEGSIPCLVLGPGSIDQAHTPDEWVDLGEVAAAVDVYEHILVHAHELQAGPGAPASTASA